jgi:hypothetical protein
VIFRHVQRYTGLGDGPGYFLRAVRGGLANFLAIAGLLAVVFGLMYRFTRHLLPHLLQGHLLEHGLSRPAPASLDSSRAILLLGAGAVSLLLAWLIRPRRRS